jgi:hypothetical protein
MQTAKKEEEVKKLFPVTINYVYYNNKRINELTNRTFEEVTKLVKHIEKISTDDEDNKITIVKVLYNPTVERCAMEIYCQVYTLNKTMLFL